MDGALRIQLGGRRGRPITGYAIVDPLDYVWLNERCWCAAKTKVGDYAKRGIYLRADGGRRQRVIYMHREILGLEHGDPRQVDHINGDTLDNRRANLRVVTQQQNLQNQKAKAGSSSARGVHWSNHDQRWIATVVCADGRKIQRQLRTEAEAANVARALRREHLPYSMV